MSSYNPLPGISSPTTNTTTAAEFEVETDQIPLLQSQSLNDTSVTAAVDGGPLEETFSPIRSMERSLHERTQSWRSSLSNVFQEIRPLVQHAQSVNNSNLFNTWMPAAGGPTSTSSTSINGITRTATATASTMSSSFRVDDLDASTAAGSIPHNHHHHNNLLYSPSGSRPGDSFIVNLDGHNSGAINSIPPIASSALSYSQINDNIRGNRVLGRQVTSELPPLGVSSLGALPTTQHNHSNHHPHHHHQRHHDDVITGNIIGGAPISQPPQPPPPPPPPGEEVPTAEAIAQIPEARALLQSILRYVPYMCIILAKASYDMLDGILDLLALFITFSHANWVVRQEIGKQSQRCAVKLVRELVYIVLVVGVVGFMLEKKNIFISVIFANSFSDPFTLRHLLFSIGVTDLVLKLITVGVKIIITLLPPSVVEYKGRGRIFLMTEAVSQLYRGLAPIQPWLIYLLDSYTGYEKLLGVVFSAAYMVAKGSDLVQTALFVKRAFIELFKKVSFGSKPSTEQLQTAGGQCPICHDSYTTPVLLVCSHIFCEMCVGTWFDREQTCPLCRAKVVDDPAWRDGATTLFVQLY